MGADTGDSAMKPRPGVIPVAPLPSSVRALHDPRTLERRHKGRADRITRDETTDGGPTVPIPELSYLSNHAKVLDMVRDGLPFSTFQGLADLLGVPQREIASVIGIPATTLSRRRTSGKLTPHESDRLVRIARLVEMARHMMLGDTAAARRWMTEPHELLGGERPLSHASTEVGGRDVEQLIGRLRHGTFS